MILCIDPGNSQSGTVLLSDAWEIEAAGVKSNPEIIELLRDAKRLRSSDVLVIETVESFGMPVGREVFETVWWSGRFCEAWMDRGGVIARVTRKQVKIALCGTMKAKDPHIRQRLIDLYGGPDEVRKGGRLAKVKSHAWPALAAGITYRLSLDVSLAQVSGL